MSITHALLTEHLDEGECLSELIDVPSDVVHNLPLLHLLRVGTQLADELISFVVQFLVVHLLELYGAELLVLGVPLLLRLPHVLELGDLLLHELQVGAGHVVYREQVETELH
jgi:hypothetical protein